VLKTRKHGSNGSLQFHPPATLLHDRDADQHFSFRRGCRPEFIGSLRTKPRRHMRVGVRTDKL
jgi:hypothetical protein